MGKLRVSVYIEAIQLTVEYSCLLSASLPLSPNPGVKSFPGGKVPPLPSCMCIYFYNAILLSIVEYVFYVILRDLSWAK